MTNFEEEIMKKLCLIDYKDISDLSEQDAVYRMLERYNKDITDFENTILTKMIFHGLGWMKEDRFRDTIFSFYRVFCIVLQYYTETKAFYLDSGLRFKVLYENNKLSFKIGESESRCTRFYTKKEVYEKVTDEKYIMCQILDDFKKNEEEKDLYELLKTLANYTDSISNFTPHPGYPFNQCKGLLIGIDDCLPLMIEKIQECIESKKTLEVKVGEDYYYSVNLGTLKEWKKWFRDNREKYCLEGLYEVDGETIKVVKLFSNQSLKQPFPKDKKGIEEYMKKIKEILENRAKTIEERANAILKNLDDELDR